MSRAQWVGNIFMRGDDTLGRIQFDDYFGWIGFVGERSVCACDNAPDARRIVRSEAESEEVNV